MKLRRPSPALVISCIALVVACTGTAFAATVITSKEIRNGTIQNADIKKGAIQSSRLSPGLQKIVTKKGGAAASVGSTTAYEAVRKAGPENQPANQAIRIAALTVPAGAYKVTAQTVMTAIVQPQNPLEALIQDNLAIGGRCKLDAAGDGAESLANVVINQRQTPATLTMQVTRTVGAPSEFVLDCAAGMPFRMSETSIIATKVSDIVRTVLPQ